MKQLVAWALMFALLASACGGSEAGNSLPTVNNDGLAADGIAGPLPDSIAIGDPDNPNAIIFGGFFFSDGTVSQLCEGLAETFPPQCAAVVMEIDAPLETVLDQVAQSFGNLDDARINTDQGIYWTDEWVNLAGIVQNNKLVLQG